MGVASEVVASSKPYAGQPGLTVEAPAGAGSRDGGRLSALEEEALAARLQRRELQERELAHRLHNTVSATVLQALPVLDEGPRAWMRTAQAETGVHELAGPKHNPRVLQYHDATELDAGSDETPWCAAFVSWVLQASGLPSLRTARASDYLAYGVAVETPCYGAIAVVRGHRFAHVGFVVQADARNVTLLGGNQGDAVSIGRFPRASFLAFRYPPGVAVPDAPAAGNPGHVRSEDLPVLGADTTR